MAIKKKPAEHVNMERWLVSYADFMTLLFILFIILFSSSQLDLKKFQQVASSLSSEFSGGGNPVMDKQGSGTIQDKGNDTGNEPGNKTGEDSGDKAEQQEKKTLAEIAADIRTYAKEKGIESYISIRYDERGLSISITGTVLYQDASATLTTEAKEFINILSKRLKSLPNQIRVEGHTDNRPISTKEFPSNWELSAARSVNLVRYLIEVLHFDPTRLSVAGYGEYRPVASNSTREGQDKNRRVEITILKTEVTDEQN